MSMTKLILRHKGEKYLGLVKAIKFSTNLGLKEAKYFCDRFKDGSINEDYLEVQDVEILKDNLIQMTDWRFIIEDKKMKRKKVLIEIGIGDNNDKIDIISDNITSKLYNYISNQEKINHFNTIKNEITELLKDIDAKSIEKLYEKLK